MTRKQTRFTIIIASLLAAGVATGLILYAMRGTIVFFYTPSEVTEKQVQPGSRVRIGGLVETGSVVRDQGTETKFVVTDGIGKMSVDYVGQLPDLFREGQGVVAEGTLGPDGSLKADTVLAKHDEKYMPKDLADKLKEKGVWQEGEKKP